MRRLACMLALLPAACVDDDAAGDCEAAAAHLSQCLGVEVVAEACDADDAAAVLGTECADLQADAAKSDVLDPYCAPGFACPNAAGVLQPWNPPMFAADLFFSDEGGNPVGELLVEIHRGGSAWPFRTDADGWLSLQLSSGWYDVWARPFYCGTLGPSASRRTFKVALSQGAVVLCYPP